jgi:flagellar protein FliO/FliZ
MRKIILLFLGLSNAPSYALAANPSAINHSELMRVIFGLLIVLIIILLLAWILKRLNASNFSTTKGFKSLAVMTLGTKEKIMLVQAGERYLLIGITSGSINLLHDFGEQLPSGFDGEGKPSFAALLKSVSGKP